MMRIIRDLRLIPIALIASACLLVLKVVDLAFDGSRWLAGGDASTSAGGGTVIHVAPDATQLAGGKLSWAQQMFNFPGDGGSGAGQHRAAAARHRGDRPLQQRYHRLDCGRSRGRRPQARQGWQAPVNPPPAVDGRVVPPDGNMAPANAERQIAERLQERRRELETRARELDIRESLLKAAEKRIDAQLAELKDVEARIVVETEQG